MDKQDKQTRFAAPPALLAIMRAARLAGDRTLERAARQELAERFGITVTFRRPHQEVARA